MKRWHHCGLEVHVYQSHTGGFVYFLHETPDGRLIRRVEECPRCGHTLEVGDLRMFPPLPEFAAVSEGLARHRMENHGREERRGGTSG